MRLTVVFVDLVSLPVSFARTMYSRKPQTVVEKDAPFAPLNVRDFTERPFATSETVTFFAAD